MPVPQTFDLYQVAGICIIAAAGFLALGIEAWHRDIQNRKTKRP